MYSMRSGQPELATRGLYPNDQREALSPSASFEIHQRARIRLPSSLCKPSLRTYFDWEDSWNDDYAKRPALLDLFAGGGGAAMGYYLAGFRVVGVDLKPQKHYPFEFHLADALTYPLEGYDAYHASPPCQGESNMTPVRYRSRTPTATMIQAIRVRLIETGKPFIIENVTGARKHLVTPVKLCGSQFGLPIFYHRYFECHGFYCLSRSCHHNYKPIVASGGPNANGWGKPRPHASVATRREALRNDWMTGEELNESIPWQYAEFIGKYLMEAVKRGKA